MNRVSSSLRARESERATEHIVREWESTFESLPDGLAVLDASARVIRVNPAFRTFLGLGRPGLIGVPFADVLESAAGGRGRTAAETVLAGPGRAATVQAGGRWLELRVSPVDESQRAGLGFVAVLADVTAKYDLQRERARLRRRTREAAELRAETRRLASLEQMKSDLLNLVSHELRTPVTVVAGYLDMLDAGDVGELPEGTRPILRLLREQVGEMNVLIAGILEVTRLHEDRVAVDRQELDLDSVVMEAVAEAATTFGPDRIRLHRSPSPCPVLGDPARLRSIIVGLIRNALKFSDAAVQVRVEERPEVIAVMVSDRGIGIAKADRNKIFQRLGRVVSSENAHLPGTGLGLYTASEIARLHGGRLSVDSVLGEGSTFTLELPRSAGSVSAEAVDDHDGRG